MSTTTENLNLFKYNPIQDAKSTFNIQQCLNDNWDKIDTCYALMNTAISTKTNSSLDNLTDDGKTKFDGKWTNANLVTVFESRYLSTSSTPVTFTLDFLPDNDEYEILFVAGVWLTSQTQCYGSIDISSDIINTPFPYVRISGNVAGMDVFSKGAFILPVKNKKIYLSGESVNQNSKGDLTALAYRKLGVGFDTTT